jgi:hypothetical protein
MQNKIQDTYKFKSHQLNLRLAKKGKARYKHYMAYLIILSYVNFIKFFNL